MNTHNLPKYANTENIIIYFENFDNRMYYKLNKNMKLEKAFELFAKSKNLDYSEILFTYGDEIVSPQKTINDYDINQDKLVFQCFKFDKFLNQ